MVSLIDVDAMTINASAFKALTNKLNTIQKISVPNGRQYIKFSLDEDSLDLESIQNELSARVEEASFRHFAEVTPDIDLVMTAEYSPTSISGFYDEYKELKSTRAFSNLCVHDDFDIPSAVRFKTLVSKEAEKQLKELLKDFSVLPACCVELRFDNEENLYCDSIKISLFINLLQI